MKRTLSLWLAFAALAAMPLIAQEAQLAKVHGHVTNPVGSSETAGTISLSQDGGKTSVYTFQLAGSGDYKGEAKPGTYTVVYRRPDTPADKMIDQLENVKLVAGTDVVADIDMSRKEYVDKLPSEQRQQLEELKKKNAEVLKTNSLIKNLNADLASVRASIKEKKYEEAEQLMLKDTTAKPDAPVLWIELGQAQLGLKKYDEAEASFKKTLDLDNASKKPTPELQGGALSGLGEIYARQGKIPDANNYFGQAAKAFPGGAAQYLTNEAVIFYQTGNADASVAAADEALKVDPTSRPLLYYLKGNGLVQKATVDPKTQTIVLPPGCADAFQKYLELDPNGQFAPDVKSILQSAGQKISSGFSNKKK